MSRRRFPADSAAAGATIWLEHCRGGRIGGFLVILPAVAALLLIAKALETVRGIAEPVATWLAVRALFALVIEVAILVGLCFLMGLVIRAEIGVRAWGWVERSWLGRLPMYAFFKNLGQSLAGKEGGRLASALAETGEGLVPAFIVEEHADGRLTVFVPTAPAMGALFIMEPSRGASDRCPSEPGRQVRGRVGQGITGARGRAAGASRSRTDWPEAAGLTPYCLRRVTLATLSPLMSPLISLPVTVR